MTSPDGSLAKVPGLAGAGPRKDRAADAAGNAAAGQSGEEGSGRSEGSEGEHGRCLEDHPRFFVGFLRGEGGNWALLSGQWLNFFNFLEIHI